MKTLLAAPLVFLFALILAGCGSSSSSDDDSDPGDDATGQASGVVIDAVTGAPLSGVSIEAEDGNGPSTSSAADGSFSFGELAASDAPALRFVLEGYREELYARPSLGDGGSPIDSRPTTGDGQSGTETIALVPDDNAGDGGLTGSVTGSDGTVIAGALIRFIAGINFRDGTIVTSTTTAADGSWTVLGLPYGNYTCIILIDGQDPLYRTVQVFGGIERTDQNVVAPGIVPAPDVGASDPMPALWQLGRYRFSATIRVRVESPLFNTGRLRLEDGNNVAGGLNGDYADSNLTIGHTLAGSGTYRLVRGPRTVEDAGPTGEKVAFTSVGINSQLRVAPFNLASYGAADEDNQTIQATVDEQGRYNFSTAAPITVRRISSDGSEPPPGLEDSLTLIIDQAFAPD